MDEIKTYFTDKRSMIEIGKIVDFCESLVIKDQDMADAAESIETSTKAYDLTRAMLRSDKIENYDITVGNIREIDPTSSSLQEIRAKDSVDNGGREERLLELKRFKLYSDYMKAGEQNSYYKKIYDNFIAETEHVMTTLEEFTQNTNLPFFVAARMCQNFSILYYKDGILSATETAKFKESYNYALNYFMKVCYNTAYKIDNPNYDNLCKLVILFTAIQRFLNSRMENMDDIDFFDEYSIRNLFLSYGLDYFFDFPLKYQKRILKNINFLIKNKGTTKAIINVLDIFGFDNIRVMKYFICKEYEKDLAGNILLDKAKLTFYGVDAEETNIEDAINDPDSHTKYDYDEFVSKDEKYWQLSKEIQYDNTGLSEFDYVLNDTFNFVYSKYISIDSFMNLTKFGIDFTNFSSLLFHIEKQYKQQNSVANNLYFYDYNVSSKKISLFNAILALYSLTMKKYEMVDRIVKTPSAIARVYGFNYNDLIDDVYDFTKKYDLTNNEDDFEQNLKQYNLNRDAVLLNYYIREYINLNLSKEKFIEIQNTYKTLFDGLAVQTNIETIVNFYREFKTTRRIHEDEYNLLAQIYDFSSYIDLDDVENHVKKFLESKFSLTSLENFITKFELPNDRAILAAAFVNREISSSSYRESLAAISDNLSLNEDLAYYYTMIYLTSIKQQFTESEFKYRFYISQTLIMTLCNDFFNNRMSESNLRDELASRQLSFSDVYFRYLTYKFLNDEYNTVSMDENINIYRDLINRHNFGSSMLIDEIEYYRTWNSKGLISKKNLETFLANFDIQPMYKFYSQRSMTDNDKSLYLENLALQKKKETFFKKINTERVMDQATFVETFKTNDDFRKTIEKKIIDTKNYRSFRYYQALYKCCCTSRYRYELFENYNTFYEYLQTSDPQLASYIDKCLALVEMSPEDRELLFNQYIMELCNGIESYLDDDSLDFLIQGNTVLNGYIKDLIYQLVDFIKSYTIQLRELNTILLFDEKFHNKFFIHEELGWLNKDSKADLEILLDKLKKYNEYGILDVVPILEALPEILNGFAYDKESESFLALERENIEESVHTSSYSELLNLLTLLKPQIKMQYKTEWDEMIDLLAMNTDYQLTTDSLQTLSALIEKILNSIKKAELFTVTTDSLQQDTSIGIFSTHNMHDSLEAIITMYDDTIVKIKI